MLISSTRIDALQAAIESIVTERLALLPVSDRLIRGRQDKLSGYLIFEIKLLQKSDGRNPAWVKRQVVLSSSEANYDSVRLYEIVRNRTISACNDFVGLGPPPPMPEGLLERVDNAIARFDKEW